jgi:diguanylate cyclase (GGDEF)-like protein
MDLRPSQPRYADDRYAVQRRLGFPWLRFLHDIEEEYRASYFGLNAMRIRASFVIGLLGVLGFIFVDQVLGANLEPARGDWLLILVTIPALMVPLAATFRAEAGRYLMHLVFAATMVAALSVLAVINIGRAANPWFPYEALYLVVMYIYFVSGLTFYRAIVCGLTLSGAFIVTNWSLQEHGKLLYEGYYMLLGNGLGIIGHYLLERQSRLSFLLHNELEQQAILDPLTGLMNRRAFTTRIETIWRQASRNLAPVGLVLVDLDDFKKINDSCGHPFGDGALNHVAAVLRASALRPLDVAARYGGDEFIAVWYDVDGAWFAKLAEELPARLAGMECGEVGNALKVTVSGGAVLAWPRPGLEPRDAIKVADQLLYEMKRTGRGCIKHTVMRNAEDKKAAA